MRLTITQINQAIQQHYPHVCLQKGNGYFYIYSDDDETALKIAELYQTGIYGVSRLNALTLERWVQEVRNLFEKDDNSTYNLKDFNSSK